MISLSSQFPFVSNILPESKMREQLSSTSFLNSITEFKSERYLSVGGMAWFYLFGMGKKDFLDAF